MSSVVVPGLSAYPLHSSIALDTTSDRLYVNAGGAVAVVNDVSTDAPALTVFDEGLGASITAAVKALSPDEPVDYESGFHADTMALDAAGARLWLASLGTIAGISLETPESEPLVLGADSAVSALVVLAQGK